MKDSSTDPLPLVSKKGGRESVTTQRQGCCLQLALSIPWAVSNAFSGVYLNGSQQLGLTGSGGLTPCLGGAAWSGQWHLHSLPPAQPAPRGLCSTCPPPCPLAPALPAEPGKKGLQLFPVAVMVLCQVRHHPCGREQLATSLGHCWLSVVAALSLLSGLCAAQICIPTTAQLLWDLWVAPLHPHAPQSRGLFALQAV